MPAVIVDVPEKDEIIAKGVSISLAGRREPWSELQLGKLHKEKGVYIIHHYSQIKYVGKTDGPTMNFGIRLRREFQESAAQGRHVYTKLKTLSIPPNIMVHCIPINSEKGLSVSALVKSTRYDLSDFGKIRILEQALIDAYKPPFNGT